MNAQEDAIEVEVKRRVAAMREEELVDLLKASLTRLDSIADRLEQIASGPRSTSTHGRGV